MPVDRSNSPAISVLSRRTALKAALGAAAFAAAPPSFAAARGAGARASTAFAAVDAMGTALVTDRVIPGLSVAVMRAGRIVYQKGFGSANLETNTPVTPDCVFRVGSVSKQFVATAIALLSEEGRLSFDDRLSKFLPLFPRAGDVTLRQMLTHTSGLGNYTETQPREAFFHQARTDYSSVELLAAMAKTSPLFKSEPGTAWAYSNTAYVLLGLVVETVAGEPYGAFLKRRLFEPNGMTQTAVDDTYDVVPHRASGYTAKPGAPGVFRNADFISMTYPGAAGAMRSTPADLCRWHAALLGGRVVKPETLKTMLTPARLKNGELPIAPPSPGDAADAPKKPMKYGFGLFVGEFEGHEFVEHGGGIFGFITQFRSFWPQQVTFAAVVNYDGFASPAEMKRIEELRDAAVRVALA
jgi:CubicO group peptidase (beta-lactamase class C family)